MLTMVIFDVVIVLFGLYMVISAMKMNKSGEISGMLVSNEELGHCKNKKAFIASIYKKEAIFGIIMMAVGILDLVDELLISIQYVNIFEMLIFLMAFLWFSRELRNARSDYFF